MYSSPSASRTASPRLGHATLPQQTTTMEPNTRAMQVKVLYTFDDLNKTNCLARCPQPLLVQTAYLDGSTQIGIVELGICIQAITAASPELLAKLGQDFTVYAYDYSEYETPQVGQGLLSAIFASTSSTPMAPAMQSKTMVTGRVCNNVLGLFSDGVKETLEVKLRLVPVPTCLQNEYLASMEKYRDPSHLLTENFDAQVWTNFLRENPNFGAPVNQDAAFPANEIHNNFAPDDTRLDSEQPLSTDDRQTIAPGQAERPAPITHNSFVMYGTPDQVANSRPRTPSQNQRPSRPSSRASNKPRPALRKSTSCVSRVENTRVQDGSDADEGPSRKRAKITKTDWRGPSAFDSNEESLRVAASSAASIRGHRPIGGLIAAENPVRPPTPRPKSGARQQKQQSLLRSSTTLSNTAMTSQDGTYQSPYADIDSDAAMTSPDAQTASVTSTPQDIPSSPPVMRHASPTPSSPQLPMLPNDIDSGFVSGTIDECFDEYDEARPISQDANRITASYNQDTRTLTSDAFNDGASVSVGLPHKKAIPRPQPIKKTVPKPNLASTPPLPNERSQSSGIESTKPEPVERGRNGRPEAGKKPRRADSAAHEPTSRPTSPAPSEGPTRARRGSGVGFNKRQKQIRDKLHASIAAGEAPPHCENCGEIDTPTWRKAFARVEDGPPPDFKPPQPSKPAKMSEYDDTDGIVTWEPFEQDEDGSVTSHRIFKKSIQPEEMSIYEELRLCNPCGIWLFKNRQMRPHERWSKQTDREGGNTSRNRSRKKSTQPKPAEPQSDWDERQLSELPMPEDVDTLPPQPGPIDTNNALGKQTLQAPVAAEKIASNALSNITAPSGQGTLDKAAAESALRKAIQSSPPRFPGSKQTPTKAPGSRHSPINLEDDPSKDTTRRLLFPSPRKPGEVKSLDNSPSANRGGLKQTHPEAAPQALNPYQLEKENFPPNLSSDSDQRTTHTLHATRATPPKKGTNHTNLLQTPPSNKGNKALTPNPYLSGSTQRWINSFSSSSPSNLDGQMTPFTAQLTQLLSEANGNQTPSRGFQNLSVFGLGPDGSDVDGLFAFSDVNTDDLTGDYTAPSMLMPSSPTPGSTQAQGTFGLYEDIADALEI